jgi:hypothetical protein
LGAGQYKAKDSRPSRLQHQNGTFSGSFDPGSSAALPAKKDPETSQKAGGFPTGLLRKSVV